jgi:hypothetical protein
MATAPSNEERDMKMKRFAICATSAMALGLTSQAFAYHCPALIKECQATADIVGKRDGSDKAAVDRARKGCEEAMKLHQEGKHKESMIKAGDTIAEISKALK